MKDKPRLIEVAFPLKQASIASVHEKNVRHGHISTLHIWPARRPLAACRAALLATLLPDPGDPEKRKTLLEDLGGRIVIKPIEETDEEGNTTVEDTQAVEGGVLTWGTEKTPQFARFRSDILEAFKGKAPRMLDPFSGGGAIPLEAMRLGCEVTAADINPLAWFILRATIDYPQRLAGKSWPLPEFAKEWTDFIEDFFAGKVTKRNSSRKAHFSDPKQLGMSAVPHADLAWQLRAWGRWVLERSRADLNGKYPTHDGEPTLAYLWARTARDKATSGRIPLLKSFWLCKKVGRRAAFLPVPSSDKTSVEFRLLSEAELSRPSQVVEENPHLRSWGVSPDSLLDFIRQGTMNRAGVWSPLSGRPGMISLTVEDLRRQGQQGLLGAQMTAVVTEASVPGKKRVVKRYRLPHADELDAAGVSEEELEEVFQDVPFGLPTELMPPVGALGFRVPLYGFSRWRQMFTSRQLYSIGVLIRHSREAIRLASQLDPALGEGIGVYLACVLGKLLDYENNCCAWYLNNEQITHLFNRFAIPMKWDFAEASPLGGASGSWESMLTSVAKSVATGVALPQDLKPPQILMRSAMTKGGGKFDAIVTDPPYYNAIPYSDLMDFFYIWHRRLLYGLTPDYCDQFAAPLGPKWDHEKADGELIDESCRFDGDRTRSKAAYEEGMATAFKACFDQLEEDGRLAIVFANKDVDAWETLIGALIKAGATVTASWPIQTEMPNRSRGINSAALSTSVWIVCRKRATICPPGWEEKVLDRMREILFGAREALGGRNILQYYFDLGIQGPDFIWAALGPALEAYSAHPFVKKTVGGVMKVEDFLAEVRKLVLHFSLGELPGFRDVQRETQGRGESLEIDSVTQYYLLHRAYFRLDPAPAGACILFANACGKNESELKVVWNILEQGGKQKKGRPRKEDEDDVEDATEEAPEGKGNEYRLLAWQERASADGLGENKSGNPAPLIDKLHRLMFLFQQNRTVEVQQLFETWGLSNERAFKPLLQAVRELAVRDKQDAERRLVEALATQLRMNRKTIVVANEMKEVPLFDSVEDAGQMQIN